MTETCANSHASIIDAVFGFFLVERRRENEEKMLPYMSELHADVLRFIKCAGKHIC